MNSDSIRLAWAGAMIGVLALSATVTARSIPPRTEAPPASEAAAPVLAASLPPAGTETGLDPAGEFYEEAGGAVPVLAEQTDFRVALRLGESAPREGLFLCDSLGCPLEEITADRDREAALGPLTPGQYGICRAAGDSLGSFTLTQSAALEAASGQLWTDGELLYLEGFVPGTLRLTLSLPEPGYYALQLCDRDGREWSRDLFIPESAPPDAARRYTRTLDFPGLPPGLYTVLRRGSPLLQLEVRAGELSQGELEIGNK